MKKPTRIKLISTVLTLSCTAVLLGFAAASTAWISNNRQVKVEGASVKCFLDQTVGILNNTFSIYGYNIDEDEPEKMDKLSLGDYDAFIEKNNIYSKRFVRAELYYPNTVTEGEVLEIKVQCEANHLFKNKDGHNYIDKYISNLIQFKFLDNFDGSIPKEEEDGSNITEIYNQCVSEFDALGNSEITFVSTARQPAGESDKTIIITKQVALPASAVGQAQFTTDFFIEYNYSDILVRYYRNNCEDEYNLDVFEKTNIIEFEKDIVSISFALVQGN